MQKFIGVLAVILGAVLLILPVFIPSMVDVLDNNVYATIAAILVVGGLIAHIFLNKYLPLEGEDE